MENSEQKKNQFHGYNNEPRHSGNRVLAGLLLLVAGIVLLIQKMGVFDFPDWLFSWPMFLILLGLFIGFKHSFRNPGWIILVLIGGFFLVEKIDPDLSIKNYFLPFLLIIIGLYIMLRPKSQRYDIYREGWSDKNNYTNTVADEHNYLDSVTVFGDSRRKILSKDFKGGEIVTVFGRTECDFSQADIQGKISLEVVQVFGGARLIVPSNWEVKTEGASIFGGIKDGRTSTGTFATTGKTLVLKGTSIFGGIEVRNG